MNILIENQTGLVVHMSQDAYVEMDGQWAVNKVKTGHSVELSSALETATEPPYVMFFVYKYVDGNWLVENQELYDDQYAVMTRDKAEKVRAKRDEKLKECDWTVLPDLPSEFTSLWAAYRQALRDLPTQADFPWGSFPQPPAQKSPRQPSTSLGTV